MVVEFCHPRCIRMKVLSHNYFSLTNAAPYHHDHAHPTHMWCVSAMLAGGTAPYNSKEQSQQHNCNPAKQGLYHTMVVNRKQLNAHSGFSPLLELTVKWQKLSLFYLHSHSPPWHADRKALDTAWAWTSTASGWGHPHLPSPLGHQELSCSKQECGSELGYI